jgi:hypothetical protein
MKVDVSALAKTFMALFVLMLIILGISKLLDYPATYCGLLFSFFYIAYDTYIEFKN